MRRTMISPLPLGACLLLMLAGEGQFGQPAQPSPPQTAQRRQPLVLTYIANEGVLLSSGDHKVLIDALFDKPNPEYRAPSPEVLDRIMKGKAPFDGVDLLLVTHNHPDHFVAPLVARYLAAVPGPLLAAPADAVEELRKTAEWERIAPRVVSLDVNIGEKEKRDLKGIAVTARRTLHSGGRASPMNLMYLFELGGWRIFHEGDSDTEKCQCFGVDRVPVDLALVHFWFPLETDCARFLEALDPGHTALMHLPIRLEGDAPGKIEMVRRFYRDLFLMLPGMPDKILQKESPDRKGASFPDSQFVGGRPRSPAL